MLYDLKDSGCKGTKGSGEITWRIKDTILRNPRKWIFEEWKVVLCSNLRFWYCFLEVGSVKYVCVQTVDILVTFWNKVAVNGRHKLKPKPQIFNFACEIRFNHSITFFKVNSCKLSYSSVTNSRLSMWTSKTMKLSRLAQVGILLICRHISTWIVGLNTSSSGFSSWFF